jgi:hypothetical protein
MNDNPALHDPDLHALRGDTPRDAESVENVARVGPTSGFTDLDSRSSSGASEAVSKM